MRLVKSAAYEEKIKKLQDKSANRTDTDAVWKQITAMRKQSICKDACKLPR